MKKSFSASLWREGDWVIAECLDVDVASQGENEQEALDNLKEALELHFDSPRSTAVHKTRTIEVEISAA